MIRSLRLRIALPLLALSALTACLGGGTKITAIATAKEIEGTDELIGGPNASGEVGDFLLSNERVRVIVQRAGARGRNPFSYGGNLIDLDRVRFPGDKGDDRFGGATLLINGVRTLKPERVFVLEDGSATGYAIVRVEGDDAPYLGYSLQQFATAVSVPATARNINEPADLLVKTDYILRPGANFVEMRTTFLNRRAAATNILIGDVLDHGSTTPFFSGAKGFALPGSKDGWGLKSTTAIFEAEGISYGYHAGLQQIIQAVDNRSNSFITDESVWVPFGGLLGVFYNFTTFGAAVNAEGDNADRLLTIPGAGSASFSRYLIVGDGDAGAIFEGVNTANNRDSERIEGRVTTKDTSGATIPAVGADIAVLKGEVPFAHLRTDANGQYRGALPPGTYNLIVNMLGHPYAGEEPKLTKVTVGKKSNRTQAINFTIPAAGLLRLFVKDMTLEFFEDGSFAPIEGPLPANVVVARVGADPSPAGYLVDADVVYPFRPSESSMVTVDPSGAISLELEPGDYELAGFHGGAYSMDRASASIAAGKRTDRVLELARVVPGDVTLLAEFGGQSNRSGGVLSPGERIIQSFAEGNELFVGADAGARTSFMKSALELDVEFSPSGQDPTPIARQIGVSEGERVVTPGFGSFTAWPVYGDPNLPEGGGIDWDNAEGKVLTPDEIIAALTGLPNNKDYLAGLERRVKLADEDIYPPLDAAEAPAPLVAIDQPYAVPGSTIPGYFDALDLTIDWSKAAAEGAIVVGNNSVQSADIGLGKDFALFTDKWQALNVYSSPDESTLWLGLNTWFAFLNLSLKGDLAFVPQFVAIGGQFDRAGAGLPTGGPRNIVRTDVEALKTFRTDPIKTITKVNSDLLLRANAVSNAPWISFEIKGGGNLARAGDKITISPDTDFDFRVAVTTPCWAPIDRIELFSNTQVVSPQIVNNAVTLAPLPVSTFTTFTSRKVINVRTGVEDNTACRADGTGEGRIEYVHAGTIALASDAWYVAVARGTAPMPYSVKPFAFTNPIFVDRDGNAKFGPLCPGAGCPNTGITKLGWYAPGNAVIFQE